MFFPDLKNYLIAALVVACLATGGWGAWQSRKLSALERAVQVDEQNRRDIATESELLARKNLSNLNEKITQLSIARLAEQRASSNRLRKLAETARGASAAAAACAVLDAPAAAILPDSTRENLERLAADADAVADSLRACQGYVNDVVGARGFAD